MTDSERIKEVLNFHNKSANAFSKHIGLKTSQILYDIINGRNQISKDLAEKITAKCLNISKGWLLTGSGSMLKYNSSSNGQKEERSLIEPRSIPYFPEINASAGLDFLTHNSDHYRIPYNIPNIDVDAYINVFGDSMYPKFNSGEIIGIKRIQIDMVHFGYAYVVEMIDGEAYLKYINKGKDPEHWILASENEKYQPVEFHLSKIVRVYLVKAVISKLTFT